MLTAVGTAQKPADFNPTALMTLFLKHRQSATDSEKHTEAFRKMRAARKVLRGAAERPGEGVQRWRGRSYLSVNAAMSVSAPDIKTMRSRETAYHTQPKQASDEFPLLIGKADELFASRLSQTQGRCDIWQVLYERTKKTESTEADDAHATHCVFSHGWAQSAWPMGGGEVCGFRAGAGSSESEVRADMNHRIAAHLPQPPPPAEDINL
ncbi:unnamed protein product [Pleuronectes platessa]|uniref:Uncharacterized protein n=1 Tax=Pleuronectes platessa TaxID=8262 RepID=A0A9N7YN21_PLEPL|nr:unnamed protein product [Pleuronectes platessa]